MDGNVLSLDNLTTPARTEALPPPPPFTIEAELMLLRKEVLAMKQARNQPTTSRSGGRTRTRRPPPNDGGRALVSSRLGGVVEVDRRGRAFVDPLETVRSRQQYTRGRSSQRTDHMEDSATASSARTPDVRGDAAYARELEKQINKGKGPTDVPRAHDGRARGEPRNDHNHDRSVDRGGDGRQRRSVDGHGAHDGALTVRGEGSRGNRGADPIKVSAGPEHNEDNGLRPGDRYTLRNDGGSIVLVNAQTGQTKVYHVEPDTRHHCPRSEAAEGHGGRNKRLSSERSNEHVDGSDRWKRTVGPAKRTHEEHRTVDLNAQLLRI